MRCLQATELMSLQLDHLLDDAARRELDAHLSECGSCQQTWAAMKRISSLLDATPMVAPAPGFAERVNARIATRLASRQARKQLVTGYVILAAGVLLLLALPLTFLAGPLSTLGRAVADQPGIVGQGVGLLSRLGAIVGTFLEACWLLLRTVVNALPQAFLAGLAVLMAALVAVWVQLVCGRPLALKKTVVES
ncbi:MAG: hypothetical protein GXY76_01305 [Chloroflexi bacterium]|nr:hypothetical protein [Chloroflexota bacterium]